MIMLLPRAGPMLCWRRREPLVHVVQRAQQQRAGGGCGGGSVRQRGWASRVAADHARWAVEAGSQLDVMHTHEHVLHA